MQIPASDKNARDCIDFLGDTIEITIASWDQYKDAAKKAYKDAYDSVNATLGKVKKKQYEYEKAEAESMALLLSVLTIGVSGGVGGLSRIARRRMLVKKCCRRVSKAKQKR